MQYGILLLFKLKHMFLYKGYFTQVITLIPIEMFHEISMFIRTW